MGRSALWQYTARIPLRPDDPCGLGAYPFDFKSPEIPKGATEPVPLLAFVVVRDPSARGAACAPVAMDRITLHCTDLIAGDGWTQGASPAPINLVMKRTVGCDATTINNGSLVWTPTAFGEGATQWLFQFSGVLCEAFELWACFDGGGAPGPAKLWVAGVVDRAGTFAALELGPLVSVKT